MSPTTTEGIGKRDSSSSLSLTSSLVFSRPLSSGLISLNKDELSNILAKCEDELTKYKTENYVLEKLLERIKPHSLKPIKDNIEAAIEVSNKIQIMTSTTNLGTIKAGSLTSYSRHTVRSSHSSQKSKLNVKNYSSPLHRRINYSFRSDLVMTEMERMKANLAAFLRQHNTSKAKYEALIQEKGTAICDIKSLRCSLSENDKFTNNLPAENYLKWMYDLVNKSEAQFTKIRLKKTTLKTNLNRLKIQLTQKHELGEIISPVDYEELRIENKCYVKEIEEKNRFLLTLKHITGICSQDFNSKKRLIDEVFKTHRKLRKDIESKNNAIDKLLKEELKSVNDIVHAQTENERIKDIVTNYTAPSILNYAKLKSKLREIQKNIKLWLRRVTLQTTTIMLLRKKLQTLIIANKSCTESGERFYRY